MSWIVPYINLKAQFDNQKKLLVDTFERIMSSGSFILREDVNKFEQNMSEFLNVKNVVGVNSGSDALILAAKISGLKKNDEVITVAHTYVMTLSAIYQSGAKPILIDIGEDFNIDVKKIENVITKKTKAILPVHLNGRMCDMKTITKISKKYKLKIIEDAAQGLGAKFSQKNPGNFDSIACFSSHPMKILGCAGDGGFISTNSNLISEKLKIMRNHGQKNKYHYDSYGLSSRLDTLQAAILNVKFLTFDSVIKKRRRIASIYQNQLDGLPLALPNKPSNKTFYDVYSSYVVRTKHQQKLYDYLRSKRIEVFIHLGPKPISENKNLDFKIPYKLKKTNSYSKQILSLPIFPELTDNQIDYVIDSIKKFFKVI